MNDARPARLAVVLSHPTQYYSPWFRRIADRGDIELQVFYLWDFGVQARYDRDFALSFQWDIPLLDGYQNEFVSNRSRDPGTHHFSGLDNPGLVDRLVQARPDAILLFGYAYLSHLRVLLSPRLFRVPLLLRGDSHDMARMGGWKPTIKRVLRRLLFRRFSRFLAVGSGNTDYLLGSGVPVSRIDFVPHCVDNDRFQQAGPEANRQAKAWREDIGLASDVVVATIRLTNAMYPHHIYVSPDRSVLAVAIPGIDLSQGHAAPTGGHGGGHGSSGGGALILLDALTGAKRAAKMLAEMNHNAVFTPDGAEVWTSQMSSGAILRLDAVTLEERGRIQVGSGPAEVTFAKDGTRAFVANGGDGSVSVIDVSTKQVVATLPVGATPVGAWPGDDGRMYVDNEAGMSISVIEPSSSSVVRTIDLGFMPAIARTAPDSKLWVTDVDTGRVVVYGDAAQAEASTSVGAGAHAIAFSPDRTKAYVTNQSAGTVSVMDVATRTVMKTITVGGKPNGIVERAK